MVNYKIGVHFHSNFIFLDDHGGIHAVVVKTGDGCDDCLIRVDITSADVRKQYFL